MGEKLRLITDNIHDTIYLSELESQMMSTPFFNRLHDVYQSSTVYMTFPANRTKRYEHSLGTMDLAGQILYSALVNASQYDRENFMKYLKVQFESIVKLVKNDHSTLINAFYCKEDWVQSLLADVTSGDDNFDAIIKRIIRGMECGCISDSALDSQQIIIFNGLLGANKNKRISILSYPFLYQCVLQALRLVALFHDVGHPPYSHIIESTIKELYSYEGRSVAKMKILRNSLAPFMKGSVISHTLLNKDLPEDAGTNQLHERIGMQMLCSAFKGVMREMLQPVVGEENLDIKTTKTLYFVTVLEFSFAILSEANPFFASVHRILDGPVDADRLDYIMRDSINAGIHWAHVPYKRLIRSVRLAEVKIDGCFRIAFPEKMTDDIDDILVSRYKVFGRINYHHRSTKSAMLLQRAVRLLAENYLDTPDNRKNECICPEIRDLWCALETPLGHSEAENKMSRWSDSWLISVLNNALITLSDSQKFESLSKSYGGDKLQLLKELLSEVLLNHKFYYSVLKRQKDAVNLIHSILQDAGITENRLELLMRHEYDKITGTNRDKDENRDATDSLHRLHLLQHNIIEKADFELFDLFFLGQSTESVIVHILEQKKKDKTILDYMVAANPNRARYGISAESQTDIIYLYAPDGSVTPYDMNNTLFPLLRSYRTSNLWLNVYVKPSDLAEADTVVTELKEDIAREIGAILKRQFNEMFPPTSYIPSTDPGEENNASTLDAGNQNS